MFGVPRINLHQEVKQLFGKCGEVAEVRLKTDELKSNSTGWFCISFLPYFREFVFHLLDFHCFFAFIRS